MRTPKISIAASSVCTENTWMFARKIDQLLFTCGPCTSHWMAFGLLPFLSASTSCRRSWKICANALDLKVSAPTTRFALRQPHVYTRNISPTRQSVKQRATFQTPFASISELTLKWRKAWVQPFRSSTRKTSLPFQRVHPRVFQVLQRVFQVRPLHLRLFVMMFAQMSRE